MATRSVDFCSRYRANHRVTTTAAQGETIYLRTAVLDDVERECLFLHPPNSVSFEVENSDLYLSFAIAMAPECWTEPTGPCTFIVLVDGEPVFSESINVIANPDQQRWNPRGVLLPASANASTTRTVTFQTESPQGLDFRWALWGRPIAARLEPDAQWTNSGARNVDEELTNTVRQPQVKRLHASPCEKINLGCGPFPLAGWTNIDGGDGAGYQAPEDDRVIALDAQHALEELPDGVAQCIASEHFFEHFTRQDGFRMLQESFRVLRPGGVVRIHMPDLQQVLRLYLNQIPQADWDTVQMPHRRFHLTTTTDPYGRLLPREIYTPAIMINNSFHMDGHQFIYDFATAKQCLELAGFVNVERVAYGESRHDFLRGIDRHDGGETGKDWIPSLALIIEGTKP